MAIYITGDTHSDFSRFNSRNWPIGKTLTKDDYVIICGDFGGVWNFPNHREYDRQEYDLDWLSDKKWTTLFVDGNHENFTLLSEYPQIEKFNGVVGQIRESIFHLKRGQIYTIDNKKFFTFGGALSIDKHMRKEGISWWKEESPSVEEENFGLDNLEKNQNTVDYVITHTAPKSIVARMGYGSVVCTIPPYSSAYTKEEAYMKYNDWTTTYLEHIYQNISFKYWYFGHFHASKQITEKFTCLYENIIGLK
jgi:DNA repair exonuclease SbcCD nuclease subunit